MKRWAGRGINALCSIIDFVLLLRSNPWYLILWRVSVNVAQVYAYLKAIGSDVPMYWMGVTFVLHLSLVINQWCRICYFDHIAILKTALLLAWYLLDGAERFHRLDIGLGVIIIIDGLIGKTPLAAPPGLVGLAELDSVVWLMEIGTNASRLLLSLLHHDGWSIFVASLLLVLSFEEVSLNVRKMCILISRGFKEPQKRIRTIAKIKREKRHSIFDE